MNNYKSNINKNAMFFMINLQKIIFFFVIINLIYTSSENLQRMQIDDALFSETCFDFYFIESDWKDIELRYLTILKGTLADFID